MFISPITKACCVRAYTTRKECQLLRISVSYSWLDLSLQLIFIMSVLLTTINKRESQYVTRFYAAVGCCKEYLYYAGTHYPIVFFRKAKLSLSSLSYFPLATLPNVTETVKGWETERERNVTLIRQISF